MQRRNQLYGNRRGSFLDAAVPQLRQLNANFTLFVQRHVLRVDFRRSAVRRQFYLAPLIAVRRFLHVAAEDDLIAIAVVIAVFVPRFGDAVLVGHLHRFARLVDREVVLRQVGEHPLRRFLALQALRDVEVLRLLRIHNLLAVRVVADNRRLNQAEGQLVAVDEARPRLVYLHIDIFNVVVLFGHFRERVRQRLAVNLLDVLQVSREVVLRLLREVRRQMLRAEVAVNRRFRHLVGVRPRGFHRAVGVVLRINRLRFVPFCPKRRIRCCGVQLDRLCGGRFRCPARIRGIDMAGARHGNPRLCAFRRGLVRGIAGSVQPLLRHVEAVQTFLLARQLVVRHGDGGAGVRIALRRHETVRRAIADAEREGGFVLVLDLLHLVAVALPDGLILFVEARHSRTRPCLCSGC